MALLDLIKNDLRPGSGRPEAVKALRSKFPEFAGLSDDDFVSTIADSAGEKDFLQTVGKPAAKLPQEKPASDQIAAFRKSTGFDDPVPDDILAEVLHEHQPDKFPAPAPAAPHPALIDRLRTSPAVDKALSIAVDTVLPKYLDTGVARAEAAGTLRSATSLFKGAAQMLRFSPPFQEAAKSQAAKDALEFLPKLAQMIEPQNKNLAEDILSGTFDANRLADKLLTTVSARGGKDVITEESILKKARETGQVPYEDIAKRAVGEGLAKVLYDFIPKNPVELAAITVTNEGVQLLGEKIPALAKPLSEISTVFKDWLANKKVDVTIPNQAIKDFYVFGRDKLSPEAYDTLLKIPKEDLIAALKTGQDIKTTLKVPRGTKAPTMPEAATPGTDGVPPGQELTVVDGHLFGGPNGVQEFQAKMPTLSSEILGQHLPFPEEVVKEAVGHAVTVNNHAIQQGAASADAEVTGAAAFADYLQKVQNEGLRIVDEAPDATATEKSPEPAQSEAMQGVADSLGLEPYELRYDQFRKVYGEGRPEEEIQADYRSEIRKAVRAGKNVPSEVLDALPDNAPLPAKAPRVDNRGIPVRAPTAVVARVKTPEGKTVRITHQDVLNEAQGILQEERAAREAKGSDLEEFVRENGGLRSFKGKMEAEEMRDVPVRLKSKNGLAADEMAQMAYDAGLLEEPSADLLREQLKALPTKGKLPTLADVYDLAARNLEYFTQNPMAARETGPSYMARQPAYHGSPYRFEKFSVQKIGSGEGHQAYGWGLYFAGQKEVAEYYRKALGGSRLMINGRQVPIQSSGADSAMAFLEDALSKGTSRGRNMDRNAVFDAAIHGVETALEEALPGGELVKNLWRTALALLKEWDAAGATLEHAGSLYHVEIPETDEFLDWDAPFSKQPEKVRDALATIKSDQIQRAIKDDVEGHFIYRALVRDLSDLPENHGRAEEEASKTLLDAGIPGLRYLDQNSRGKGASAATHNYVLFDESRIEIKEVRESATPFDVTPQANGQLISENPPEQFKRPEVKVAFKKPPTPGDPTLFDNLSGPREIYESSFAVKYQKAAQLFIPNQKITSPADLAFAFRFLKDESVEHLLIGAVKNGRIQNVELLSVGVINQVNASLFEMIHLLDRTEADSFFLVHNHPSGLTDPSDEDIRLTKAAEQALGRSGFDFLGHIVIDDTQFGFIDNATGGHKVRQYLHQEYAEVKKIPLLKKYTEWLGSKTKAPLLTSPRAVFELMKGIAIGEGEGVVFLTNNHNRILNTLVVPQSQMTVGGLQRITGRYRANSLVIVNSGLRDDQVQALKRDLRTFDVTLHDDVEITRDGDFRSRAEHILMEKSEPNQYSARERIEGEDEPPSRPLPDEYERARNFKATPDTTAQYLAQRKNAFMEFARKIGVVFSTRLSSIDPTLKTAVRRFEFDYRQAIKRDLDRVRPFLQGLDRIQKANPGDYQVLDLALKNGHTAVADTIMQRHNLNPKDVNLVLKDIRARIQAVGFEVGYLEGYFPRIIRDRKGFLKYLEQQKQIWGEIEMAMAEKAEELGRDLNEEEKVNLINSFIRGFVRSKIALARTGNMKTRIIDRLTPDAARFYYSQREALVRYIAQVNEAIEARKFFGRAEVKPDLSAPAKQELAAMTEAEKKQSALSFNNVNDSIGAFVNRLLEAKKITPDQEKELKDLFQARFGYVGSHGLFGLYKDIVYMDTISNPIAAISNLDDLGIAMYRSAWDTPGSFFRALANRSKISLDDLHLESVSEEIREMTKSAGVLRSLLRVSGFSFLDKVAKETQINTIIDKYRSDVAKGDAKAEERLVDIFGSKVDDVIEDLKSGKTTENILFLAFNELSEMQPISLSEVPEAYLQSPGARLFYSLKTFMVKRLDFLRDEVIKAPDGEKLSRFLKLYAWMIVAGAGVDELKDFILRRKTTWQDRLIDNMLKPFGIGKYVLYRVRDFGPGEIFNWLLIPPHKLIDSIWKDVRTHGDPVTVGPGRKEPKDFEITASIPIGGKLWYWWYGRGAQKTRTYEYKQQRHRAKARAFTGL